MFLCSYRPCAPVERPPSLFAPDALGAGATRIASRDGTFCAAVSRGGRARVIHRGPILAVGEARLDEPVELEGAAPVARGLSDLELVVAALEGRGDRVVDTLVGDFAFVAYDARTRTLLAARDPFGVKALYVRETGDGRLFGSHARMLVDRDAADYDVEFVAGCVLGCPDAERTMWRDVRAHRPGAVTVCTAGRASTRVFWQASRFAPVERGADGDRCRELGHALRRAVRARVGEDQGVFAQLSGGLDSSSIVCLAAELAREGACAPLVGAFTRVERLGEGDEETFADDVAARAGVRHEKVNGGWYWRVDAEGPPETDFPWPSLAAYAQERRERDIVLAAGSRALLSGHGGDHCVDGPLVFLADDLARGHPVRVAREVFEHAIAARGSFWETGLREAVAPLLPARVQLRLAQPPWRVPCWARGELAACIAARMQRVYAHVAPPGRKYAAATARELDAISYQCEREPFDDAIEMRYPFLDRRVVELCLELPPRLRVRPGIRKWALREAMRGVLPESVRTRTTKSGPDARMQWSLSAERAQLDRMLVDPWCARLGLVDAAELRGEVERARSGRVESVVDVMSALALETWLTTRHEARHDTARSDGRSRALAGDWRETS